MVTRLGEVKRTAMSNFANIRSNGLIAFDIEEGDDLRWVLFTPGDSDLIFISQRGQSIRFREADLTERSRAAGGVRGMRLREGDQLVAAECIRPDSESSLLVVGENGFGKRTPLPEYRVQGRGGSGILTMNCTPKTGEIVGAQLVDDGDRLIVLTIKGKGIRMKVSDIRTVGRVAQGVKLINLAEGDAVASVARLVSGDGPQEPESAEDEETEGAES
jgi:DNA gyrase subunit A